MECFSTNKGLKELEMVALSRYRQENQEFEIIPYILSGSWATLPCLKMIKLEMSKRIEKFCEQALQVKGIKEAISSEILA